ncbi:hypothetical protein NDN68_00765 [Stenotrophomonas maltophilia]|uniref:hypothetical protein n=1 Tax=Stenotrophomonas maltophilia TaxID=40324 RepID=UPI0020372B01|nr:hypothetical protein [Stenotrophomonas maltophilia]MCM2518502.1 hypothetical protein [Stenotrophomonas maltophilia]
MSGDGSGKGSSGSFRDDALEIEVTTLWLNLVRHVDDVFVGHKLGFENILNWADPSLDKIVVHLTAIGSKVGTMLDILLSGDQTVQDTERVSTLINCDHAIHLVRRVHVALQRNDEDEYKSCMKQLQLMFRFDAKNCPRDGDLPA